MAQALCFWLVGSDHGGREHEVNWDIGVAMPAVAVAGGRADAAAHRQQLSSKGSLALVLVPPPRILHPCMVVADSWQRLERDGGGRRQGRRQWLLPWRGSAGSFSPPGRRLRQQTHETGRQVDLHSILETDMEQHGCPASPPSLPHMLLSSSSSPSLPLTPYPLPHNTCL